jgi:ribosome maturation factor RimP
LSISSSTTLGGIDREALLRVVEPVVRAHGGEIVDIEFRREQPGWVLRLYVEKQGSTAQRLSVRDAAVDLSLCAGISRDLSPALDIADLVPHAYHLEVSSPGLERPLRGEDDFVRFAGQKAKVRLREPAVSAESGARQRVVIGILGPVHSGIVTIVEAGRTHEIPLSDIDSARLVFEFGPKGRAHVSSGRDARQQHRKH